MSTSSASLPEPAEREVRATAGDRTSGAMALGRRAARLLRDLAATEDEPAREWLGVATARLIRAQPSMAPLLHVANHALLAADGPEGAGAVVARMEGDLRRMERVGDGYAAAILSQIGLEGTVVTLSHSSLVERVLGEVATQASWRVVIAASEPGGEGRVLAERLAGSGHELLLVPDAAAPNYLRDATLLLGADAVSPRGLVNKVGTMGLAGMAHFLGRPVLVLASEWKLVPRVLDPLIALDPHAARALWPSPPRGVRADDHLFDLTPLAWLSQLYSERGVLTPADLRSILPTWVVHPSLEAEAARR